MGLGAQLADERSVRDVGMGGLTLEAVYAVRVELVVGDYVHHEVSQSLWLLLV